MVEVIRWTCFLMVIGLAVVIGSIISATAGDPDLYIDCPPNDTTMVYSDTITVYGRVKGTDGAFIKSVTVNSEEAKGNLINWNAEVSLQPGQNPITIVATDNFGNNNTKTRIVDYIASTPSPTFTTISNGYYRPAATPTPTGSILITTIPCGAEVYLDGSLKGITNITLGNVTVRLHEIKVTKKGFDCKRKYKYVRAGRTEELDFVLKSLTGSIFVFSMPPGASVYLDDDIYMNKITPCMLSEVAVGPHSIKLTKSGYVDEPSNKYVSADEQNSLHVTLKRCAYINISSNPPGANVYLDGNDTGETTPANISKDVGNYSIKLTKFGYSNNESKVDVSVAKTYHIHVNLSGYGYINISSDPSGARVCLDGNDTGETTPANISKGVGNYSIRLTKRNYKNVTQEIQVSAGNTTPVYEFLSLTYWERKKPWIPLYVAIISLIGIAIFAFVEIKKAPSKKPGIYQRGDRRRRRV